MLVKIDQSSNIAGIYTIVNTRNLKKYVGSSKHVYNRANNHLYDLNKQRHINPKLQRAWNKYKETAFELNIVQLVEDRGGKVLEEDLLIAEQFYLDNWWGDGSNLYNISRIAGRPPVRTPEQIAKDWTPERRAAAAQRKKGTKDSDVTKAKKSASGKKVKHDWGWKTGLAQRGQKRKKSSPETREKISVALKGKPQIKTPARIVSLHNFALINIGREQSVESNIKRSEKLKGVPKTETHKANFKKSFIGRLHPLTGKKRDPAAVEKGAQKRRGKKSSPETIAKRVASRKLTENTRRVLRFLIFCGILGIE